MIYIRFLRRSPNVLEMPEAPDFEEMAPDYFQAEPKDDGLTSFWLHDAARINATVAGFVARKPNAPRSRISWARLDQSVFANATLPIDHQPDPLAFACIADLHFVSPLEPSSDNLKRFIRALREYLLISQDYLGGLAVAAVKGHLCDCAAAYPEFEREKCQDWAINLIQATQNPPKA